jgi:hypothetical protein
MNFFFLWENRLSDQRYFEQLNFWLKMLRTIADSYHSTIGIGGRRGRDRMVPVQLVPITTKIVSSNRAHGEVYSIQHYVIKFVSDLRQVGGFLRVFLFPPPIKLTATI